VIPSLKPRAHHVSNENVSRSLRDNKLAIRAPPDEQGDAERARSELADLLVGVHGALDVPKTAVVPTATNFKMMFVAVGPDIADIAFEFIMPASGS